jgi:hypothetical protein
MLCSSHGVEYHTDYPNPEHLCRSISVETNQSGERERGVCMQMKLSL